MGFCIGLGVSKADVAREMGISVGQLNRKFPEECRLSKAQLEIRLTTRLAQMGLEGDRPEPRDRRTGLFDLRGEWISVLPGRE